MAEAAISQGALQRVFDGEGPENMVLQCVLIKSLPGSSNTQERFRLVLSDTQHFVQGMLSSQLNSLVHEEKLKRWNLVRINQYQQQFVKGKRIFIVLNCEVLEEYGELGKIGDPKSLDASSNGREQEEAPPPPPIKTEDKVQPEGISTNGFYGNKPQQQLQAQSPLPARVNKKASSTSSYGHIHMVEALNPYANKWTIKVRCTFKSDIKTWHNKNGEGKLFSVNFLDESGEIRATGFNDQCDMLYEVFHEGSVYYISSPCKIQLAKRQFSNVNNDYELVFESQTIVEKAEDQESAPRIRYNFTNIGDLQSVEKDTTIDTIGILKEVEPVAEIVSKTTSKPYNKRELNIVDNTGYSVRLTIWGNTAVSFDASPDSVIAFKGVKVSDFGGRSLSLLSSGSMAIDPDIDEAHKLKGWYEAQGRDDKFQTHSSVMGGLGSGSKDEYKTIGAIKDEQLGMSEKADYFTVKGTVIFIKQESIAYPGCQTEKCNKKVHEEDGSWRCETCNKTWDKPQYRYFLQFNISDFTGQMWLICSDDVGRLLIGLTADELMDLKENDEPRYTEKVADANCRTWVFRCRAKMETFKEETRVRYQVSSAHSLNFQTECSRLAAALKQYSLNENDSLFVN